MSGALAVFDLDGTLVDTAPDLADTTNVVLAAHGYPGVPDATLRPCIGLGARAMIACALEKNGIALTAAEIDRIHARYLDVYASRIAKLSRPFPEMIAALDRLAAEGVAAAVCTNKKERLARQLLDALSLTGRFAEIAGGDTYGASKPDPLPLLRVIENAGGAVENTVFVGDSRIDRETARAANVPIVGVTYGYSDVAMRDLDPERLLGPGEDVAAAILDLLATRAAVATSSGPTETDGSHPPRIIGPPRH
jgi:phosphoglycolate phosphatase